MSTFYPTILKWNTNTVANGETMSTSLSQLESNDNHLLALINELSTEDGTISYVNVVNNTSSIISKGMPVYVNGAIGDKLGVALADNTTQTKSTVIGLAIADIAPSAEGNIMLSGIVSNLDTHTFTAGTKIYLGASEGSFTTTEPIAPAFSVLIGNIINSDSTEGKIFVNISTSSKEYKVKVSDNDSTPSFVDDKINVDVTLEKSVNNDGGNENIELSSKGFIKVDDDDNDKSKWATLIDCLDDGTNITFQIVEVNGKRKIRISASGGGGGSGEDTYMLKWNVGDSTPGFLLDKLTVAPGSPITLSETGVLDILEEDVSDPLIKTVSLLSESGKNHITGSCWSSVYEEGEWGTGFNQNTSDSYYRLIPDARGTVSKVTFYVANINGEDAYYGGDAGAIRIGLFDADGVLKGSTAWTRGITTLGTHTLSMTAEAGQTLTIDRNTTYWIGVIGRGLDLIAYEKLTSGLNLTNLRYSVRIRSGASGAMWSDFLTSGTGFSDNAVCVIQMSAT